MSDIYFTDSGYQSHPLNTLFEPHHVFEEHYVPKSAQGAQGVVPSRAPTSIPSRAPTIIPSRNSDAPEANHQNEVLSFMKGAFKNGTNFIANDSEIVTESLEQHKYAILAKSSYDYFDSRGKIDEVHDGLRAAKHNYVEDLKGFEVDTELSTIDNLVLHNPTTGETHVSYRGTTNNPSRLKTVLKDWRTNGEIAGGSVTTKRYQQAEKQIDQVIAKYGKKQLTVSGHSQGGGISYEIAVSHDIPGHHYNPAINSTQVKRAARYAENEAEQVVYKTATDFASPLTYDKRLKGSKTTTKVVNNLVGKDGVVDVHSIDQFAPTPKEVEGAIIKAERRTLAGSVVKSAGKLLEVANYAGAAYTAELDIQADLKNSSNALEKVFDIGIDTAKNAEKFAVDNAIADVGLGLAGETFGASAVVAMGAIAVNDFVADHVAVEAKKVVRQAEKVEKSVEHTVVKTAKKIGHFFGF